MAILSDIPPGLTKAFNNLPEKGERNVWLFTVAMRARRFASAKKVKKFLLCVAEQWNDRDFSSEIDRAVRRAFASPEAPPEDQRIPTWPDFNQEAWNRRLAHPVPFSEQPLSITSEEIIDSLFGGNPLICAAVDVRSAKTQLRGDWRGTEAAQQFIVANPMLATTGLNQDGEVSTRCLDNASKQRTYQVVEFDRGNPGEQAAILASLSNDTTPLVMVVWSGNKSFHGWFHVERLSEYATLRFFRHAVYLGADHTLWDPSKLVRMPGGRRDNGNAQHVYYFNPNSLER
jgi:hypothetical protein